jgi:Domain of unknown function (DUF4124)
MSPRILAVVLLLVAPHLCAETYKWVDEKGVTNYSSSPPASATLAKKAQVVEERLSVYTPDPGLLRAIQVRPQTSYPMPYGAADAFARQQYAVATQAMYDDCLAQRRVDCNGASYYPYGGYLPYIPVFVVGHVRRTPEVHEFHARSMAPSSRPAPPARMMRTSSSWSR